MQFLVPYLPPAQRRNHAILKCLHVGNTADGSVTYHPDSSNNEPEVVVKEEELSGTEAGGPDDSEDNVMVRIKDEESEEIRTEPDLYAWSQEDLLQDNGILLPREPVAKRPRSLDYRRSKSLTGGRYGKRESDPDMDFLCSLLPEMKKLPDHKKMIFKIRNLELLNELLYANEDQSSNENHASGSSNSS